MGDRVRICVAGVGREGIAHARNFRWRVPGAVLEAVVDAEPQRAAWAAEDLDLEGRNHIGLEAALDARGIDAVVNTTPWFTPRRVDAHGGGYLSGIIYGSWPGTLPENADTRPYANRSVASLMQAAKVASDQGVQLNVEVVNRFERFTMNARQESMENVQDVGNPCGNISQDTFHTNIEEDTIRSAVDRAGGLPGSPALARATSHRRTLATSSGMNTPPR